MRIPLYISLCIVGLGEIFLSSYRRIFICLFMYTASVMFDFYCRDSELFYNGVGDVFQSTPPLEGAGVFNVLGGDSLQNTEPPFTA